MGNTFKEVKFEVDQHVMSEKEILSVTVAGDMNFVI